ncbi:MAG: sigma-70 family RNA polymerase sigma factor [Verrucomicrobiota bacterium]
MEAAAAPPDGLFGHTQWSTVLKAKEGAESTRFEALSRLLQRYRRPIIRHIQYSRRCDEAKAEELAHEFIAHWLKTDLLKSVTREKGRFRTFIKTCVENRLEDLRRFEDAGRRKPEKPLQSLDEVTDEGAPLLQVKAGGLTPDESMDVEWAHEVVNVAVLNLERECIAARRGGLFLALKPTLGGDSSAVQHAEIAARLGTSEGAIKTAYHRLKQRLGQLIREEIKQTVGTQEDWQDELRYLIGLLAK